MQQIIHEEETKVATKMYPKTSLLANLGLSLIVLSVCIYCAEALAQGGNPYFPDSIQRLTVATNGDAADNETSTVDSSADGQLVLVKSFANNLPNAPQGAGVPGLFLITKANGSIRNLLPNVDTSNSGPPAFHYISPRISGDGRFVVFSSNLSKLVAGDTNNAIDVFLLSIATGVIERMNVSTVTSFPTQVTVPTPSDGSVMIAGSEARVSHDGRFVIFVSRAGEFIGSWADDGLKKVYVHDRALTKTTPESLRYPNTLLTAATGKAENIVGSPSISDDGRYVVFESTATNMVIDHIDGESRDIYYRDRSQPFVGARLVNQRRSSTGIALSTGLNLNQSSQPLISGDGLTVTFVAASNYGNRAGCSNSGPGCESVYQWHQFKYPEIQVSAFNGKGSNGQVWIGDVSRDGSFVSYLSTATNLSLPSTVSIQGMNDSNGRPDILVWSRDAQGSTVRASAPVLTLNSTDGGGNVTEDGRGASVSDNGQVVTFISRANDLTDGSSQTGFGYVKQAYQASLNPSRFPIVTYSPTQTVNENSGTTNINVRLSRPATVELRVGVSTVGRSATPGRDYYGFSKTIIFPAGVDEVSTPLSLRDDNIFEYFEYLNLRLLPQSSVNFSSGISEIRIEDDDSFQGSGNYDDVAPGFWAYLAISALDDAGIAGQCSQSPRNFCPGNGLRRDVLAKQLVLAVKGASFVPPAGTGQRFNDVPASWWAASWVEEADRLGIDTGFGSEYRPAEISTRAAFAVALVRAKYGSNYIPPPATGVFSDLPVSNPAAAYVEKLRDDGVIVNGCNGSSTTFCPDASINRAVTAVLIVRTFGL